MLIEGGHLFDIMALRVGTHWGGEKEGAHLGVEGAQLGEEGRVLIWGGCSVRRGREGAHLRGGKRALIKAWALSQGSQVYSFSTQA